MTGLIWFVQVVHYPLFAKVGPESFKEYEHAHQRQATWVVAPLMLIEAGTAAWLVMPWAAASRTWATWSGLLLLLVVWLSTLLVQMPLHAALEVSGSRDAMKRLVRTNWIRTVAWTMRAVLAGLMIAQAG